MIQEALSFYNSRTRKKEFYTPITPGQIKMYVCGITVYDYCHMGHARMLTTFDVLNRALRAMGYDVFYVRNITDIDDKIINRAAENKESIQELTERYIHAMHEDEKKLNILAPTIEPRATEYIPQMIDLIDKLLQKKIAYQGKKGDIYYEVNQFPGYGSLSGQDLEKLRSGIRILTDEDKQDPLDFVLWKKAKPGEPSWPSPWGEGRPGWHIECSAMSCNLLGAHFDLHGGGMDLLFPHHENEVAQSVAGYEAAFANIWLHNGFVQINDEKMSKSIGNFLTIKDILKEHDPEVLRYFLIAAHYRSPLNYDSESLQQAVQSLDRIYTALRNLPENITIEDNTLFEDYKKKFFSALADDLNTPEAFALIFELVREINRLKSTDVKQAAILGKGLRELLAVLGLAQRNTQDYFMQSASMDATTYEKIEDLVSKREEARKEKNWKLADEMREKLAQLNVLVEDTAQGVQWRIEKKKEEQ